MKFFLIIIFFVSVYSQNTFDVIVNPQSKLTIIGESNVSDYECLFEHDISDHDHRVIATSKGDSIFLEYATLKIPIKEFDCGLFLMNQDFRSALGGNIYPHIIINIVKMKLNYTENKTLKSISANLNVTIRDFTRNYNIEFTYDVIKEAYFIVTGRQKMTMKEFNIKPPNAIGGLIYACDEIEILFNLVLKIIPTKKG